MENFLYEKFQKLNLFKESEDISMLNVLIKLGRREDV